MRSGSWLLSAVIHGALILGAMTPVVMKCMSIDRIHDGFGSGFFCSLGESTWRVDRIERPVDIFTHRLPDPWVPSPSLFEDDPDCCYSEVNCGPDACPVQVLVPPNELDGYACFSRGNLLRRNATFSPRANGILCFLGGQPLPSCKCPFRVLWRNDRCEDGHGIDAWK